MKTIEFIGPPGSGKSTVICELLQERDDILKPTGREYFLNNGSRKYTLPYQFIPTIFTNPLNQLIESHYRRKCLYKFIATHPKFLTTCSSHARNTKRPEYFLNLFMKGAELRHLANITESDGNLIILDENLCHYGAHMMTEYNYDPTFSEVSDYFDSFTSPDVLVHVNPPSDVGIKRQNQRGGIHSFVNSISKECKNPVEAQERFRGMCQLVVENLGSEVIEIQNTNSVKKSVNKIIKEL